MDRPLKWQVFYCLNCKNFIKGNLKEHFIVWNRISTLNKFRKQWGIIETNLEAGEYILQIQNSRKLKKK